MRKVLKSVGFILLALVLIVAVYAAYLFIAYHRLGSGPIDIKGKATGKEGNTVNIVSWNIGFGAYEADYDFFLDGGKQSWAPSKERLNANLENINKVLEKEDGDIYLIQEIDLNGTRTYHVDETAKMAEVLGKGRQYAFAQNFDSPFLMYPILQPHGANKSGIMTFSKYPMSDGQRIELPIEDSIMKILDYDRCYSKQTLTLNDGSKLVLYNFHLSAYTSDGKIAVEQLKMILSDMQKEYEKGNRCIAGGDFNKDLQGDSSKYFGVPNTDYNWAKPIPEGTLEGYDVSLVAPLNGRESKTPVPTARNADSAYHEGQFVVCVDGFLVTPNVSVKEYNVIETKFAYSDHNPVRMTVELQ